MTAPPDDLQQYAALVAKVDAFWRDAVARQPDGFQCRDKCASCCHQRLSVQPVEAEAIRRYLDGLPEAARQRIAERASGEDDACVFLLQDRCLIYPARPLICRTHGLAVRVDGAIDHCPLNFQSLDPHPDGVLDLERINTLLVLVDRLFLEGRSLPPNTPRIPLERLVAP